MFDRLKRIFIIEEEKGKADKSGKTIPRKQSKEVQESVTRSASKDYSSDTSEEGTPSAKFSEILFKAIEDNGLEGFDYLEYKESLQSLAKMNMDEATRYKSAFAMAQTMGVTPEQLLNSATHYKNVLSKEESKFGQALENQRSKQINEQEQKIANLEKSVATKRKQLEQLQQQIGADEQALVDAKAGLSGAAAKINATKANFMASFQQIWNQLEADIEKMKMYLK